MKDELYEYFLNCLQDIWNDNKENIQSFNKNEVIKDFLSIPNSKLYLNGQFATTNDINSFMWAINQGVDIIHSMYMSIKNGVWYLRVNTND